MDAFTPEIFKQFCSSVEAAEESVFLFYTVYVYFSNLSAYSTYVYVLHVQSVIDMKPTVVALITPSATIMGSIRTGILRNNEFRGMADKAV